MKRLALLICLAFPFASLHAQQWNGAATDTTSIHRFGSVGIGIVPQHTLHVKGSVQLGSGGVHEDILLQTGASLTDYNGTFHILPRSIPGIGVHKHATYFKTAGSSPSASTRHDVLVDGRIGIGLTNPTFALEVNGHTQSSTLRVVDKLTLGDGSAYNDLFVETGLPLAGYNGTLTLTPRSIPGSGLAKHVTHFKTADSPTAGLTRHDVLVDGRVGIGVLDPTSAFHIAQPSGNTALKIEGNAGSSPFIQIQHAEDAKWYVQWNNTGYTDYYTDGDHYFHGGSVGLGTPTPANLLHLHGSDNYLRFSDTDATTGARIGLNGYQLFIDNQENSDIVFRTSATEAMRINHNGKVGIGTGGNPNHFFVVQNTDPDSDKRAHFNLYNGSPDNPLFDIENAHDGNVMRLSTNTTHNSREIFEVNNADGTQFVVKGDGKVGIGTSNPYSLLDIQDTDPGSNKRVHFNLYNGSAGDPLFDVENAHDGNVMRLSTNTTHESREIFEVNNANGTQFVVKGNGRVGLGTTEPDETLHLAAGPATGLLVESNSDSAFRLQRTTSSDDLVTMGTGGSDNRLALTGLSGQTGDYLQVSSASGASGDVMRVTASGDVGIGITTPGAKLAVNGTVKSKEVIVTVDPAEWADYVFEDDYDLRSLAEVEAFIEQNGHLPEVPSAAEVGEKGVAIGDMQATLLKKIEELTLYLMDQQRLHEEQQRTNEHQRILNERLLRENAALRQHIEALRQSPK